tara:strand:+ start:4265 stop:7774 length:3510 start_codon:yes stop_codon:yes gene_type:complete
MKKLFILFIFALAILFFGSVASFAGVTKEIPYASTSSVTPNVLVILDNSGSMLCPAYFTKADGTTITCGGPPSTSSSSIDDGYNANAPYSTGDKYYGYFDANSKYSYASGEFTIDSNGDWDGNFLNWVSMRRVDVAKKVLVGGAGLPTARQALAAPNTNVGSSGGDYDYIKKYDRDTGINVSNKLFPDCGASSGNDCYFGIADGKIYRDSDNSPFNTHPSNQFIIKVNITTDWEAGVIQEVSGLVRLGLEYFNSDSEGGDIDQAMADPPVDISYINAIENLNPSGATPLAESLYTAAGYFGLNHDDVGGKGPEYHNGDHPSGVNEDPFDFTVQNDVYCSDTFVILISDGDPTNDSSIPSSPFIGSGTLTDYDGDGDDGGGDDYLDDVALWAHTTDLRTDLTDLEGDQTITLYTIFAFGSGSAVLKNAAVNGGFDDDDGDNVPDPAHPGSGHPTFANWAAYEAAPTTNEWDENADGSPDNYYDAETGEEFKNAVRAAFTSILAITNAVTAPVVMPGAPGTGNNLYAATFVPDAEHQWAGHLKKFPLDSNGFLQGTAPNFTTTWNAGDILGDACSGTCTSSDNRKIFTVESTVTAGTNNIVETNWSDLMLLLGTNVAATRTLLGYDAATDPTYELSTKKLINFVRGKDVFDEDIDSDTTEDRWKLGDVFNSGPIEVGSPPYFYNDSSDNGYLTWKSSISRTTTVYVGGNDGMLHAFNSSTGVEMWAFIPPPILGNLKDMISATANQSKSQYYVDSSPIVDDVYVNGSWMTILICGFRWGDRGFFALDVTDPNNPDFLAAVSTDGTTVTLWNTNGAALDVTSDADYSGYLKLGYTWSVPITGRIKVDVSGTPTDKWVAIFGGGYRMLSPDVSYTDLSDHAAGVGRQIFVVDLSDASIIERFTESADPAGNASGAIKDDSADGIDNSLPAPVSIIGDSDNYFQYLSAGDREGHLYQMNIEGSSSPGSTLTSTQTTVSSWTNCEMFDAKATYTLDSVNPANTNLSKNQANNRRYIYAQPEMTDDSDGNRWIFFGTGDGRNIEDLYPKIKTASSPDADEGNLFVAIKNTTPNPSLGTAGCPTTAYTASDLTDVTDDSTVFSTGNGWYIHLVETEKSFTFPTIFASTLFFTTFIPDTSNICELGDSYLYIVNFQTGGVVTASGGGDQRPWLHDLIL